MRLYAFEGIHFAPQAAGDADAGTLAALRPFNVYGPGMDTEGAYTEVLVR